MRLLVALLAAALLLGCAAQGTVKDNGSMVKNDSMEKPGEGMEKPGEIPSNGSMNNSDMLNGSAGLDVEARGLPYFDGAKGYLARPEAAGSYPGVIMIHEWWGLNDNMKDMAEELASKGYVVLAVDLYDGKVASTPEEARALVTSLDQSRATSNMQAAIAYLRENESATKMASLGWCFGGGQSLQVSMSGEELDATVIYYGNVGANESQLSAIGWPVLGIFGENDTSIPPDSVREFESRLDSLGIENDIYIYPGVGHAFANPSGANYAPDETVDAWDKTLSFLEKNLKGAEPADDAPEPAVKEFSIKADDNGFYPPGPITVAKGDTVRITFEVDAEKVYYGGLQFKGQGIDTGKIAPGMSTTVEFVADEDMTITSYWGATLVKKADLQVDVS